MMLLVALLTALQAGNLPLDPRDTVLALPAQPAAEETQAAQFLQEWLRKACRSPSGFEIVGEDKVRGKAIALGRTRWAPKAPPGRDGFAIRRVGPVVALAGGSPAGTYHCAAHFLDRFCGVRFYLPGDLFTSLPPDPRIALPEIDLKEEPFVRNCMMTGTGYAPGEGEWVKRNSAFRKEAFSHQHSMFDRFPPETFAARYPTIYPILDGTRYVPASGSDQAWQPCLTEPALVDAAGESAAAWFAKRPDLTHISFSIQDSNKFCQCPRCASTLEEYLKADPQGGRPGALSRLNAEFLNRVAERLEKKFPDKTIVYIAYSDVRLPPPFRLHRNILPVVVFTIADTIIDRVLEPPDGNLIDLWSKAASRFGHHDWGQGQGYLIPRFYPGLQARVLRAVKAKGLDFGYAHFEAYPNWGLDGPKLFITSRLWWNPDTDPEKLLDRFCADLFPRAREPLKEYWTTLEKLWIAMDNQHERKLYRWGNQFLLGTDEQRNLAREARKHLDRALGLAADGPEKSRVELFSKSYRLTEYLFELSNPPKPGSAKADEVRRYAAEKIIPDPMTVFSDVERKRIAALIDQALTQVLK
jgi:hypothetical protein